MRILYDHQIFSLQPYGGISRYYIQILSHLISNVKCEIAIRFSDNIYLKEFYKTRYIKPLHDPLKRILPLDDFPGKEKIKSILRPVFPDPVIQNKEYSIQQLKKQDFDVFHPTYYDDYFLKYIGNKPFILTIHDMIHELYPEMVSHADMIEKKAILASKAAHIIAVSEQTKKDIIEILNISAEKITVIYHASSLKPNNTKLKIGIPDRYILFIGDRLRYKNFLFFAYSIRTLLLNCNDLYVFCTGSNFTNAEKYFLKKLDIEKYFVQYFIPNNELFELYSNALAFVFPSYYEGFGIPILEAFEAECPVILSKSSCFPEIAGDAALYFDPKSKNQIVSIIQNIIEDNSLRTTLIKKGKKRLESFSWAKSAEQTMSVYKKILNI